MNKQSSLLIVLFAFIVNASNQIQAASIANAHRIHTAIAQLDVVTVRELTAQGIFASTREGLLKDAAKKLKNCKRTAKSLFSSSQDLLSLGAGSGMASFGSMIAVPSAGFMVVSSMPGFRNLETFIVSALATAGASALAIIGSRYAIRGWCLNYANNNLAKAQEIEMLVKNCPVIQE